MGLFVSLSQRFMGPTRSSIILNLAFITSDKSADLIPAEIFYIIFIDASG